MPPKTRRAANAGAQSTLSFKNRVTKSSASAHADRKLENKLNTPAEQIVTKEIARETTPEPAATREIQPEETEEPQVNLIPSPSSAKGKRKAKRSSLVSLSDEDSFAEALRQAEKISDAQIKKYWAAEEANRVAPRVHQTLLPLPEKILRHFDLVSRYGPCTGITRHARWRRAHRMKQEPPIEVLAVILKEEAKEEVSTKSMAAPAKGKKAQQTRSCGQLAYVDELLGGKLPVAVE